MSNLFAKNTRQQSALANKEGMICPGLSVNRPASVTNLSAAYYNNIVATDPLLYSYQGCTCAPPLLAHYEFDANGKLQGLGTVVQHVRIGSFALVMTVLCSCLAFMRRGVRLCSIGLSAFEVCSVGFPAVEVRLLFLVGFSS